VPGRRRHLPASEDARRSRRQREEFGTLDGAVIDLEGHELRIVDVGQADTAPSTIVHVPRLDAVIPGDVVARIRLPTKHRSFPRNPDGHSLAEPLIVSIVSARSGPGDTSRCRRRDSNPRHADYDSAALTS
jgi:hypothetical protein